MSRKNGRNTDGTFAEGNPGKSKGTLHRATRAAANLIEGEAEAITRKAIDAALGGDMAAMRLCMDRISPPRKYRSIEIALPKVETAANVTTAHTVVIEAMARGDVTPDEASTIASVLEAKRRSIETCELEARMVALEMVKG